MLPMDGVDPLRRLPLSGISGEMVGDVKPLHNEDISVLLDFSGRF